MWGCVFSFYQFPLWWFERIYTLSYYHHQIGSMNYHPLFRVRSWNNGVRCMSSYILMRRLRLRMVDGLGQIKPCFKQYVDTRYLVFYIPSPPRMFLSLDIWQYRIQHGANGPLYVTSSYSTWIFCRGVSGFATDCLCGICCRGLTTCLLHVGPPYGNRILNNSWAVGLT